MPSANPGTLNVPPSQIGTLFNHSLTIPNALKAADKMCRDNRGALVAGGSEFVVLVKELRDISSRMFSLIECCMQRPNRRTVSATKPVDSLLFSIVSAI